MLVAAKYFFSIASRVASNGIVMGQKVLHHPPIPTMYFDFQGHPLT